MSIRNQLFYVLYFRKTAGNRSPKHGNVKWREKVTIKTTVE